MTRFRIFPSRKRTPRWVSFLPPGATSRKTIEFQPDNPVLYGELGVLYHKNRNYETGILALECAVRGCTAERILPCARRLRTRTMSQRKSKGFHFLPAPFITTTSTLPKLPRCSKPPEGQLLSRSIGCGVAEIEATELDSDPNIAADIVVVRNICSSAPETPATATPATLNATPTAMP